MADDTRLECREFVELVTAYLENALPTGERTRFEAHIAVCPGCATYVEQMRQTIRATGALTEDVIPELAMQDLLQVFRGWKVNG
jgi:anti-sigma factor RsiW